MYQIRVAKKSNEISVVFKPTEIIGPVESVSYGRVYCTTDIVMVSPIIISFRSVSDSK